MTKTPDSPQPTVDISFTEYLNVPLDLACLISEGAIIEARQKHARLDATRRHLAIFKESVLDRLPAALAPYLDFHEDLFDPAAAEHIVSVKLPQLWEIRSRWCRESDERDSWVLLSWSTQDQSALWAIVPAEIESRMSRASWHFSASLPHALYLAMHHAAAGSDGTAEQQNQDKANLRALFAGDRLGGITGVRLAPPPWMERIAADAEGTRKETRMALHAINQRLADLIRSLKEMSCAVEKEAAEQQQQQAAQQQGNAAEVAA